MNNKDIIKAIENKQYLCLEDPIGGSEFLNPDERILNTYICIGGGDVRDMNLMKKRESLHSRILLALCNSIHQTSL